MSAKSGVSDMTPNARTFGGEVSLMGIQKVLPYSGTDDPLMALNGELSGRSTTYTYISDWTVYEVPFNK
jgi:hypothetical protein